MLFGVEGLQVTDAQALPDGTLEVWAVTGITNATSESLNRLAELQARLAYGFRNPANQRRRVRIACTRGRRRNHAPQPAREHTPVIGPKSHPG